MTTENGKGVFASVRPEIDFPSDEARVLAFWKDRGIFAKTLSADTRFTGPSKGSFAFYEGPPTANGMPHNGHVLTRAVKDLFPRYKTMQGYDVPRKAGWDTHGLPVEVEVEKDLGIHGKADIEAFGIKPFIQRCVESVFRYTHAWERNTEQTGYWTDLADAYVTYHKSYVESVWWALSELHNKGLLFRGHKVVWWWPQGGTALSSGEVGEGYKEVDDPSCYVAMELVDHPGTFICAWTTTPWTLPSNGYAAVRGDYDYVEVTWTEGRKLILAAALREEIAKKLKLDLEVVRELKGSELVGQRYRPCFDTFARYSDSTGELKAGGEVSLYWRIIDEQFVTLKSGTGIVHIAPAFGEDDNNAHKAQLRKYVMPDDVPLICAVNPDGTMTEDAGPFAGKYVKDADPLILADLKQRGVLVHQERYRHDYPFCWRAMSDPLIQLARPAWYIRTTDRIDKAIANNQAITWLPEHIKDGRFGDFLANNVDWALSRERFWGTPLNVWVCDVCGAEHAPASVAAIEDKNPEAFASFARAKAEDPSLNEHLVVHKPWIDEVTFGCEAADCAGTMRRVPEVIDCWFDSGCMPFAQFGFPHADGSKDRFDQAFPADFISEAIDQTRGWFYSLLMVSTMVFDEETCARHDIAPRPYPFPYKSCVVLGHICDKEGKKESKSKGNYTPPDIILDRVRMEFAPVPGGDDALGKLKGKAVPKPGVALIAREDYEGLDLTGESAAVRVHREDRDPVALTVKPVKGLPRRIAVLAAEDITTLGLTAAPEAMKKKPSDVLRLPAEKRLVIEDPSRPAPGADAFRWFFYSASPPWTNTRHSLSNVRLAQKDFMIKLRNVFSFFCIYANIDGFSPAAGNEAATDVTLASLARGTGYRPAKERALLDRWMASELALTVKEVSTCLDGLLVYDAAQRIVELVDALSNWYVRRSRGRFWASSEDPTKQRDKLDASWTLYEALVSLSKMVAPFVPFFAEEMYQNLVRGPWPTSQPESVHLTAYPVADEAAIDEDLAVDMRAVRELVSLGLQVRTDNQLKVRQPLHRADVVVSSSDRAERLEVYRDLIAEELNVHEVRWLLPGQEGGAVSYQLKPNFRALGPRLGKQVQAVKKALAAADAGTLRSELAANGRFVLSVDGSDLSLDDSEVQVAVVASDGFAAAGGKSGVVVLHTALDDQLLDEGLAREVLAALQGQRKKLALGYTDRIAVSVRGSARVQAVVNQHREHLVKEVLCASLEVADVAGDEDDPWFCANVQDETIHFHVVRSEG